MSNKKTILFLTSHLPYPPHSGGRLREYELLKGLSKKYRIFLWAVTNTFSQDNKNIQFLEQYCDDIKVFEGLNPNINSSEVLEYKKFLPDKIIRIVSRKAELALKYFLKTTSVDLIHIESFYMQRYVTQELEIPTLLAAQNIEFDLIRQELDHFPGKKEQLLFQFSGVKEHEVEAWKNATKCVVLTQYDYDLMSNYVEQEKIHLITNGFDHIKLSEDKFSKDVFYEENTILITGNYQYKPNEDGVLHFCKYIFPKIQKNLPSAKLFIVGNQPTEAIFEQQSNSGIKVVGRVESLTPYLTQCDVFVCPLRIGGGIKVKMLEALMHNCAIVTTPIGAQGIPKKDPPGFLEAKNDDEFGKYVLLLLQNKQKRSEIKDGTKIVLEAFPTWEQSVDALSQVYSELMC